MLNVLGKPFNCKSHFAMIKINYLHIILSKGSYKFNAFILMHFHFITKNSYMFLFNDSLNIFLIRNFINFIVMFYVIL